jgi:hypothetical protein
MVDVADSNICPTIVIDVTASAGNPPGILKNLRDGIKWIATIVDARRLTR